MIKDNTAEGQQGNKMALITICNYYLSKTPACFSLDYYSFWLRPRSRSVCIWLT